MRFQKHCSGVAAAARAVVEAVEDRLLFTTNFVGDAGTFGETGASAVLGDEVGSRPALDGSSLDGSAPFAVEPGVTDPDGQAADAATVQVSSVGPAVAVVGAPPVVQVGTLMTLDAVVSDPGVAHAGAGFRYQWTASRNGQPYQFPSGVVTDEPRLSFTPALWGSYQFNVTVLDQNGGYIGGAGTPHVWVVDPARPNAVPNLTAPAPGIGLPRQLTDVNGTLYFTRDTSLELWRVGPTGGSLVVGGLGGHPAISPTSM